MKPRKPVRSPVTKKLLNRKKQQSYEIRLTLEQVAKLHDWFLYGPGVFAEIMLDEHHEVPFSKLVISRA